MTTVHLFYPHKKRISCPDVIGNKLGELLGGKYNIIHHWESEEIIYPGSDDILIGHPQFRPWAAFNRSMKQKGWKRIITMFPFCPANYSMAGFENAVSNSDTVLAITGNYWFRQTKNFIFSHWLPKMTHVDLAVDRKDFPAIKARFNKQGERQFVYIGNASVYKNTNYLTEISSLLPANQISWIGKGRIPIKGLIDLGQRDFQTDKGKECILKHDFVITVGHQDANPATILEAMAWGLIPVCTPQSGYISYPGIINVPLGDAKKAADILHELQELTETKLKKMQEENWKLLDSHFNWNRFAEQVANAIESDESPALAKTGFKHRFLMLLLSIYYKFFWRGVRY